MRPNYVKLFENIPKLQDQKQKLRDILEAEGLKGTATMEKAKKLKLKRENRAEVASLDLSNIVDRRTRRASIPLGKRVKSPKKPANVADSGEEEEEEEVRGRRILQLNPALFDDDESD